MAPEERHELQAPTDQEIDEKAARGEELKTHKLFEDWCRQNGIIVIHSRTDRKPTIAEGHPDFTVMKGEHYCFVEFKAKGGKLSEVQAERIAAILVAKCPCRIAFSFEEARAYVIDKLQLQNEGAPVKDPGAACAVE